MIDSSSPPSLTCVVESGLCAWFAWTAAPQFSVLASGVDWDKTTSPPPDTTDVEGVAARALAAQLRAWLRGCPDPLPLDNLDLASLSPFSRRVLTTLHETVPRGQITTYGALAAACGTPGAARAVGNALRRNPFPLFLPCHRVISADGRIGGFQGGAAGARLKARLLAVEGGTGAEMNAVVDRHARP
jgi:O-6-methylguanine DNA methyltransferase